MADNVISFENFVPTAKEASVNYSKKMCDNQDCNKVRTATHTSDECWRKHPDLIPETLRINSTNGKIIILKVTGKDSQVRRNPNMLTRMLQKVT